MGKVLQIRVMAQTFDQHEVRETWPRLTKLIWGDDPLKPQNGVMELARSLDGHLRMGMLPDEMEQHKDALATGEKLVQRLENALGDWNATEANKLSLELEDHLTELEKTLEMV